MCLSFVFVHGERPERTPPEETLSDMFAARFGVELPPDMLRAFIKERWHLIAPLAHAIHDAADVSEFFNEVELGASHHVGR